MLRKLGILTPTLASTHPHVRQPGAKKALMVLFLINLFNYADRYVPSAVKELIKTELNLTDFQTSLPATMMVVVYMFFAMYFGTLNDRNTVDRRVILCVAIIMWSLATALAGAAGGIVSLVIIRSLVGVGEAAYGTIAAPLLSDYYPKSERNLVFSFFYVAIPIGAALGFAIGAGVGASSGWRSSFYVCGIPGIIISYLVLTIYDPARGINDHEEGKLVEMRTTGTKGEKYDHLVEDREDHNPLSGDEGESEASAMGGAASSESGVLAKRVGWEGFVLDIREILGNKAFLFCLLGGAANNFALGGIADWFASFYMRYIPGASLGKSGLIAGAASVVGGIGGSVLGAKAADHYVHKFKNAYFLVPALFCIPASICLFIGINVTSSEGLTAILLCIFEIFAWTSNAPINAISNSCIPPRLRGRSNGVMIFGMHILGDIISPPIIGLISDATGSLQAGLQCTWIAILVSGAWWFYAYRTLSPIDIHNDSETHTGNKITDFARRENVTYQDILCGRDRLVVDNITRNIVVNLERGDTRLGRGFSFVSGSVTSP